MWAWFLTSFNDDPAGWISAFIAIAALILSAVFWRTTRAVFRAIGCGIAAVTRHVFSIRITTKDRLKSSPRSFVIEPRWVIGRPQGLQDHEMVLFNAAKGSTARNVRLESWTSRVQIISTGQWPEVPGGQGVKFDYRARDGMLWPGVDFHVSWIDGDGRQRSHTWLEEF